jgi:hypothetical protein
MDLSADDAPVPSSVTVERPQPARGLPRFTAGTAAPRPAASPGETSLLAGLDENQAQELERLDWSVRRDAFAAAALTPEQAAKAEAIFRDMDRRWLEIERRMDPATGRLAPGAFADLYRVHRQGDIQLMDSLTNPVATRIRTNLRQGYLKLAQAARPQHGDGPVPLAGLLGARRLEIHRPFPPTRATSAAMR